MEHFITVSDYSYNEIDRLLDIAEKLKKKEIKDSLHGKNLILLFFNPSLRTRTSFEIAMMELGGNVVTLNAGEDTWKIEIEEGAIMDGTAAEHIKDAAKVLGRYADAIGIRAFAKGKSWGEDKRDPVINAFKKNAGIPIINMESSLYHPNQSLADILTVKETYGKTKDIPITITWAYHPNPLPMAVPNSILLTSTLMGMNVRLLYPEGYDLDDDIINKAKNLSKNSGGSLYITHNIEEAFEKSLVVYAKSWGSLKFYGNKEEERNYRKKFKNWIINDKKMNLTDNAIFLHCLPVRRNVIVTDSVIDSSNSKVYDEAENRIHVQKAVLLKLLNQKS